MTMAEAVASEIENMEILDDMEGQTSNGFCRKVLYSTLWEWPARYSKLKLIGTGAYGQVCSGRTVGMGY